jgi:PKD repeat protein
LSFTASGSSDPDGSIVGYAWDFGDGNTASGVNITHNYGAAGSYQVSLMVTDDGELTTSAALEVQIVEDETGETL